MTLLSTITNDEINKNLKERFFNQEIYVSSFELLWQLLMADVYRPCADFGQPI